MLPAQQCLAESHRQFSLSYPTRGVANREARDPRIHALPPAFPDDNIQAAIRKISGIFVSIRKRVTSRQAATAYPVRIVPL